MIKSNFNHVKTDLLKYKDKKEEALRVTSR